MTRTLLIASLALTLATACKRPPEPVTPDPVDAYAKGCAAGLAAQPVSYFGDSVLLRPPVAVTADHLVEVSQGFARLAAPVTSASCDGRSPGGQIEYMAIASFIDESSQPLDTWSDEILMGFGYSGYTTSFEKRDDHRRFYQVVLDVPSTEFGPPSRALFQLKGFGGVMIALAYESSPAAWPALEQAFLASAETVSVAPSP